MTRTVDLSSRYRRIAKLSASLLITFGISLAIFAGAISAGGDHAILSVAGHSVDSSEGVSVIALNQTLIAYSVDYEMDKARGEKTIEHYGEGIRPLVEQAIENNEDNPNSKATAENSYERESSLNDLLPESIGESFSEKELSEMENAE